MRYSVTVSEPRPLVTTVSDPFTFVMRRGTEITEESVTVLVVDSPTMSSAEATSDQLPEYAVPSPVVQESDDQAASAVTVAVTEMLRVEESSRVRTTTAPSLERMPVFSSFASPFVFS